MEEQQSTQKKQNFSNYKPKYHPNNRGKYFRHPQNPCSSSSTPQPSDPIFANNTDSCISNTVVGTPQDHLQAAASSNNSGHTKSKDYYNSKPNRYIRNSNNSSGDNRRGTVNRGGCPSLSSGRGQIVSGRYVRRNNAYTTAQRHFKSYNENNIPYEPNTTIPQNTPYPRRPLYKPRNQNSFASDNLNSNFQDLSVSQEGSNESHQQDSFVPFDQNYRNYARSSNFHKKTQSKGKVSDQLASSDVYRYSTQDGSSQLNYRTSNVFTNTSSRKVNYKDNATQRELLIQNLNKGDCECLVCCEQIRVKDQTWHCLSCFHVFHLWCVRKWARSPAAVVEGSGWRCPACQSLTANIPYDYFCFCGRQKNPDVNYHLTPHSCGEICGRKKPECEHLCKELCHPGPCPPCAVVVRKSCPCGKTSKSTPCKQVSELTCSSNCEKILNCGVHTCQNTCHSGECSPCEREVYQTCFCKKSNRSVICTAETATVTEFPCATVCGKVLKCGNHSCEALCHPDDCRPCALSVERIKNCPCGRSTIEELISLGMATARISCKDSIPVCNNKCEKILPCGVSDKAHVCQSSCHVGECPECPLTTSLKCRCGAFTKEFNCIAVKPPFSYLCERRCNKRKDCGRHKCLTNCCVSFEHRCDLVCNRKMTCGLHQCQETCHGGNCPTCWNVSFDELRCHCGESVLYPPIHCGTKPPECPKPCIRQHACRHDVKHTCHSDEQCPPCTYLTNKWCYGRHKQCGSVMCFLDGISCGSSCSKELACGKHKCILTCHSGPCLKSDTKCSQACPVVRESCGHPCGSVCHDGPCPDIPCRAQVTLVCPCGHRSETTSCYDSTKSFKLMSVSVLASKMQEIKDGQSVNLSDVLGKKNRNTKLQCNEECAVLERNKRLAVALQIQNPDISCSPTTTNYSEFLKNEARKSPSFVSNIYDKISDLVQLAKESKQKCRSNAFPPMNRDQRRVVHELAEFFGCETQSYDEEPKKNVVVTAYKAKCWLPFVSLMTVVQRDMGFRKGPAPVLAQRDAKSVTTSLSSQKKKIDYFDYNE